MGVRIEAERGRGAAEVLYRAFGTGGILGNTEMPEDIAPAGVVKGSLEHVMFITLSVAIDYQRDADVLWESSRRTFEGPETRYLFDPQALHENPPRKIMEDMQKYKLSKKPKKDADIWRTVGVTFYKKWEGDPRKFLANCGWNAPKILQRLKDDRHLYNNQPRLDYPYLRGDKIGPLWLRMLRDNVGIDEIKGMEMVPIPVDVHVGRATLAIGVVRGEYKGNLTQIFAEIRRAWFQSVYRLEVDEREMIALDVDEPLWHLSRYGCTKRDKESGECPEFYRCELKEYCVKGKVVVNSSKVELMT